MERGPTMMRLALALMALSVVLLGCGKEETSATKAEENAYRNPSTERPQGSMPSAPVRDTK